jgi:hypothetical protein
MRASKSGMIFAKCLPRWLLIVLFLGASAARAQSPADSADTRDTLVYKDGDRVRGHLIERKGDLIVFKSDRFGELRVPAADAVIIKGEKPEEKPAKQVVAQGIKPAPSTEEREEEEKVSIWNRFSPAVLTAKVRDFFGPWHGRLSFSNEIANDTAHHDNIALEGKLSRKFTKDTVDLNARYDYDQINGTAATDVLKSGASWRHDFSRKIFGQYRPTVEWNRAAYKKSMDEYVLAQQEIGLGVSVYSRPTRKVRLGVSENLFDIWSTGDVKHPGSTHGSHGVVSLFDETELALPWRMTLTQRGVWYPESIGNNGWEDQIELNKKLTETLSVAVRHELRRNNPDGVNDYTRLKLMLGLDF